MTMKASTIFPDPNPFQDIGAEVGALVAAKNIAYGDSFARAGEVMGILYPDGIEPSQMRDALGVVRVLDKLFRIATRKEAFGESPWKDIAGYGILGAAADEKENTHFLPRPPPLPAVARDTETSNTMASQTSLAPPPASGEGHYEVRVYVGTHIEHSHWEFSSDARARFDNYRPSGWWKVELYSRTGLRIASCHLPNQ